MIGKKEEIKVIDKSDKEPLVEPVDNFAILKQDVDNGRAGKNKGIPMGFDRLNSYIGLRKKMYFLLGGNAGSGKTSALDSAFILNPVEWILSDENRKKQKLHIIYRSMERSRSYKLGKWVSRRIFMDTGRILSLGKLLGWTGRLDDDDYKLFLSYKPYINEICKIIHIIDGPENPIGITAQIREHALAHGTVKKLDKYNSMYVPNDPDVVTMVVVDHIGLLKTTKDYPTKKAAIEKLSVELRRARDFYGYTPVVVSQFNRSISNITRIKNGDVEPQLEDFKDSAQTQEDCDVALSLFDPMRYKVEDPGGYDLSLLRDAFGAKYFRSIRILKNSYGSDDVRIGLGFLGSLGMFKELPRMKDMTDDMYESVTNKTFFMKEGGDSGSDY